MILFNPERPDCGATDLYYLLTIRYDCGTQLEYGSGTEREFLYANTSISSEENGLLCRGYLSNVYICNKLGK